LDPMSGLTKTATPSEPLVADTAAHELLMGSNWSTSIQTFVRVLLRGGIVNKGQRGELYSRLICILSRDYFLKDTLKSLPTENTMPSQLGRCALSRPFNCLDRAHRPSWLGIEFS